jgi:LmbE family N-acetylglucosaminyl deacetylase
VSSIIRRIVVIAPHPDDESLGCGGTLLRHAANGDEIFWIIVTGMDSKNGYPVETIQQRAVELSRASAAYGFSETVHLNLPTTRLDTIPRAIVVNSLTIALRRIQPHVVYLPHPYDVHSDHGVVFQAAATCLKWFRLATVEEILAYETLSETEFGLDVSVRPFSPNVFVDISPWLERKLEIMRIFASEMGNFPFPRSEHAIRAQASGRGASMGCEAAEAFALLRSLRRSEAM